MPGFALKTSIFRAGPGSVPICQEHHARGMQFDSQQYLRRLGAKPFAVGGCALKYSGGRVADISLSAHIPPVSLGEFVDALESIGIRPVDIAMKRDNHAKYPEEFPEFQVTWLLWSTFTTNSHVGQDSSTF